MRRAANHAIGANVFSVREQGDAGVGLNQRIHLIVSNAWHVGRHNEDALGVEVLHQVVCSLGERAG